LRRRQVFDKLSSPTRPALHPHGRQPALGAGAAARGRGPGLRETAFWTPPTLTAPDAQDRVNTSAAYGFVFDICGLDVDPATGRVDGRPLHHRPRRRPPAEPGAGRRPDPRRLRPGAGRRADGGVPLRRDGSFQSGTLADYLVPTACEVPDPVIVHLETPSPFTPLGAKGLGEGNNMSTPVCIANAFADALRPCATWPMCGCR
jgi:2-furoyl-CoA dehydrogenase large subunit